MLTGYLLLCGSVSACASSADAERDLANEGQPFSTELSGEPVHEAITDEGLSFLQPAILTSIRTANVSVDTEFALVNANHFDDCNFSGGAAVIRRFQSAAVAALDPGGTPGAGDAQAMLAFGQWLHTAQDFYAHSNWVELGGQSLADDTLDLWAAWSEYETLAPSGFRLVQGSPPQKTSVTRKEDAPYPEDAIVRVKRAQQQSPGVITGTVDYEPGDFCPPQVAMTHAELNKDHSATPGRTKQFATARALAVEQTHHEWCRFVAMARSAWGDAGEQRLMTWVADPSAATCP